MYDARSLLPLLTLSFYPLYNEGLAMRLITSGKNSHCVVSRLQCGLVFPHGENLSSYLDYVNNSRISKFLWILYQTRQKPGLEVYLYIQCILLRGLTFIDNLFKILFAIEVPRKLFCFGYLLFKSHGNACLFGKHPEVFFFLWQWLVVAEEREWFGMPKRINMKQCRVCMRWERDLEVLVFLCGRTHNWEPSLP